MQAGPGAVSPGRLDRWSRWSPLTAVVAALLGITGSTVLLATNPPGAGASGDEVLRFYAAHGGTQRLAGILLSLAWVSLVLFTGVLRSYLRAEPGLESLAALVLAGGVLEAVGQTIGGGMAWTLADGSIHLNPAAAQAINALSNDVVLTSTAGIIVLGLAGGLAMLRSSAVPSWLGWLGVAMAVLVVSPLEALAFIGLLIWIVALSVLMLRRPRTRGAPQPQTIA